MISNFFEVFFSTSKHLDDSSFFTFISIDHLNVTKKGKQNFLSFTPDGHHRVTGSILFIIFNELNLNIMECGYLLCYQLANLFFACHCHFVVIVVTFS